jgi:hypothetical protein
MVCGKTAMYKNMSKYSTCFAQAWQVGSSKLRHVRF